MIYVVIPVDPAWAFAHRKIAVAQVNMITKRLLVFMVYRG